MKLYIKYMVSLPCKILVKEELERLKIPYGLIDIGAVEITADLNPKQREKLRKNLWALGLKLYSPKKGVLFEKIRDSILEMIRYPDGQPAINFSTYLSSRLGYDYTYLANIFSEVSGISIQQYIILSKIEVTKELLLTGEVSLSQISFQLHYSSVAHLSSQFKKVTGLSPTCYKLILQQRKDLMKIEENNT